MNLLITGVAGFIGSKIAEAAVKRGYYVYGVDDLSNGRHENIPENVTFIQIDLSNKSQLQKLPENIDVIMHLAGQSSGEISFDDPIVDLEKNTISTLNLIEYGIQNKVGKIIYASSMSVYGDVKDHPVSEDSNCSPLSCYGVGKLASENYLKVYQKHLPFVIFRMFNVYGPGQDMSNLRQGMVSIFLQHALTQGHIPIKGSLNRYRDFIYIDDVVEVWLQAIDNESAVNKIFNLGTGIKTSIENLLLQIKSILPEISWSEVSNTPGDQYGMYANTANLAKDFDSGSFITLKVGLENFVRSIT